MASYFLGKFVFPMTKKSPNQSFQGTLRDEAAQRP